MTASSQRSIPADFVSEMESKYFWWEPVGDRPRSESRVLAQAMDQASFADIRRLETIVGPQRLFDIMRQAEPGWFNDRSWEFWRGRLAHMTGQRLPEAPPRRKFTQENTTTTSVNV